MKKSQLRNIIRELINEQQFICDPPPGGCPPGESWNGAPICLCAKIGSVYGCMDATATNYDPLANVDDGSCTYTSACPPSVMNSCTQQWLPPNMNWPNMTNFGCTGGNTFSSLMNNMGTQVANILTGLTSWTAQMPPLMLCLSGAPCWNTWGFINQPLTGSWSNITSWVNTNSPSTANPPGISNPGQLKRKIAKAKWAQCMQDGCGC